MMTCLAVGFFMAALPVIPAVRSEKITPGPLPREGYRIRIDAGGKAKIEAADPAGRFYAEQTLKQLPRPLTPGEIEDAPAFPWRGVHLDESRHFFGKAAVMRILDRMASLKMNVFHWHLMDAQGNRFPLKSHPRMNTVGATRPAPDYSCWVEDETFGTYGPFVYTAEEIAEVRAHAKARHIRIVPEVEIPGHSREVIAAYPDLFCGTVYEFCQACAHLHEPKKWKMDPNVVCLGNPDTIRFFEDVIDDVCELFPDSDVIHIGGDECSRTNWMQCAKCRTKMKELGVRDPGGLQNWCTRHFVGYLARKCRRAMGWDEILEGGLADGAYLMSWHGAEGGRAAAKSGHFAVMCPHELCYFDYPQGLGERDPCRYPNWEGVPQLTVEKVYSFDPCAGIPEAERKFILGGQANNWTEVTKSERELQLKMWPRMAAMAEVLWTGPGKGTFSDFKSRLQPFTECLARESVAASPAAKAASVVCMRPSHLYSCGERAEFEPAFSPYIRAAVCEVPNYGNAGGPAVGRPSGEDDRGKWWKTSLYFDSAYCAPRITCPVFMSCGFTDDYCTPETVYCIYNALRCRKVMYDKVENGHGDCPKGYSAVRDAWLGATFGM